MLLSSYVVGIAPTPTLSYRLEFCWRQKVNDCKVLAKTFAFQICLFFPQTCMIFSPFYIENNVSIVCLDLFVHELLSNWKYYLQPYVLPFIVKGHFEIILQFTYIMSFVKINLWIFFLHFHILENWKNYNCLIFSTLVY